MIFQIILSKQYKKLFKNKIMRLRLFTKKIRLNTNAKQKLLAQITSLFTENILKISHASLVFTFFKK